MPGIDYTDAPLPKKIDYNDAPLPSKIDYSTAPLPNKPPPVTLQQPNANAMLRNAMGAGMGYAKQFGDWATTSIMPDAEDAVGDMAEKIPYIGDYAGPIARTVVGGATSPLGLGTLALGSIGLKAYKGAKAAASIPYGPLTAEDALVREVQGATKLTRKAQEAITTEARSSRISDYTREINSLGGGEAAHDIAKGKLSGPIPKVQYEPIREKFATADNSVIDRMHKSIQDSKLLTAYDKVDAHGALDKVLGSKGVEVPQGNEIKLLTNVFGPDFGRALDAKQGVSHKILDVMGVPRTVMASGDASFPMRQNISNISRADFWKNLPEMVKAAPDKGFQLLVDHVKSNPHYELAIRSGLDVGDYIHEENFASKVSKYYPGVKNSENMYGGYAKEMRMDLFSELVDKAQKGGNFLQKAPIDAYDNSKYARELAKFVNISTGRGTLKVGAGAFTADLERSAKVLNSAFFSPRLASSRIQMFTKIFDPSTPVAIRKEYLRNALGYMGFQGALLTSVAVGAKKSADVVTDITSPDFAKVKVGNTRLDFSGGVAPYVRLIGQLAYGQKASSISGKVTKLNDNSYKATTDNDVIGSFINQKMAPIPATMMDIGRGWKDSVGQPTNLSKETIKLMTPILANDIYDIIKDDPNNLPYIIPAIFGVGVNTYGATNVNPNKKPTMLKVTLKK